MVSMLLSFLYAVNGMRERVVFFWKPAEMSSQDRAIRTHYRDRSGRIYAKVNSYYSLIVYIFFSKGYFFFKRDS